MKKIITSVLISALCLGIFSGCSKANTESDKISPPSFTQAAAETRTVTDWNQRTVEIPAEIDSVICVGVGSLRYTTYLQALDLVSGVEEHEIGADCTRPFSYVNQSLFKTLPITGNNGKTYDEQIIAVDPDVIVAFYDAEKADSLQKKLGIPVVTIPHLEGILDEKVFFTLDFLGDLYGRKERAQELTEYLKEIQKDIETRIAPETSAPSVYVSGVSYKGAHGFEGTEAGYAPLAALKAVNIADAFGKGLPFDMDMEEVLRQDPDYIFVCNEELVQKQYAQNPEFFRSFSAVKEGHVYSQISYRNCATNTEMALANLYYMGSVLYPDAFRDVEPAAKTNEILNKFLGVSDYYSTLQDAGYRFEKMDLGNEGK